MVIWSRYLNPLLKWISKQTKNEYTAGFSYTEPILAIMPRVMFARNKEPFYKIRYFLLCFFGCCFFLLLLLFFVLFCFFFVIVAHLKFSLPFHCWSLFFCSFSIRPQLHFQFIEYARCKFRFYGIKCRLTLWTSGNNFLEIFVSTILSILLKPVL